MTAEWTLYGRAAVDQRPPSGCALTIRADGSWVAEVATFTLAGNVDLLFTSDAGGRFCGPAFVERSRADTEPTLRGQTGLTAAGPLLVIGPGMEEDALDIEEPREIEGDFTAGIALEASA